MSISEPPNHMVLDFPCAIKPRVEGGPLGEVDLDKDEEDMAWRVG